MVADASHGLGGMLTLCRCVSMHKARMCMATQNSVAMPPVVRAEVGDKRTG